MIIYEIVGGLVFLTLVALGLAWLMQNVRVKQRRK